MTSSISGDLGAEGRLLEAVGRAAEAPLAPGQRLSGRVIEMLLTGDVLLELGQGQGRATVATGTPLQPGARVQVEVVIAGPAPEFRIVSVSDKTAVTPPPALPEPVGDAAPSLAALSPRDLPVILRALADMGASGIPIAQAAQAAQTFLRAAVAADLHPAVLEQIQRWLAPLDAALPAGELAPVLRAFLAQSGLFTENRLGAMLQ